jgi:hypothetical protein
MIAGFCEYGYEPSGSPKDGIFVDRLSAANLSGENVLLGSSW